MVDHISKKIPEERVALGLVGVRQHIPQDMPGQKGDAIEYVEEVRHPVEPVPACFRVEFSIRTRYAMRCLLVKENGYDAPEKDESDAHLQVGCVRMGFHISCGWSAFV